MEGTDVAVPSLDENQSDIREAFRVFNLDQYKCHDGSRERVHFIGHKHQGERSRQLGDRSHSNAAARHLISQPGKCSESATKTTAAWTGTPQHSSLSVGKLGQRTSFAVKHEAWTPIWKAEVTESLKTNHALTTAQHDKEVFRGTSLEERQQATTKSPSYSCTTKTASQNTNNISDTEYSFQNTGTTTAPVILSEQTSPLRSGFSGPHYSDRRFPFASFSNDNVRRAVYEPYPRHRISQYASTSSKRPILYQPKINSTNLRGDKFTSHDLFDRSFVTQYSDRLPSQSFHDSVHKGILHFPNQPTQQAPTCATDLPGHEPQNVPLKVSPQFGTEPFVHKVKTDNTQVNGCNRSPPFTPALTSNPVRHTGQFSDRQVLCDLYVTDKPELNKPPFHDKRFLHQPHLADKSVLTKTFLHTDKSVLDNKSVCADKAVMCELERSERPHLCEPHLVESKHDARESQFSNQSVSVVHGLENSKNHIEYQWHTNNTIVHCDPHLSVISVMPEPDMVYTPVLHQSQKLAQQVSPGLNVKDKAVLVEPAIISKSDIAERYPRDRSYLQKSLNSYKPVLQTPNLSEKHGVCEAYFNDTSVEYSRLNNRNVLSHPNFHDMAPLCETLVRDELEMHENGLTDIDRPRSQHLKNKPDRHELPLSDKQRLPQPPHVDEKSEQHGLRLNDQYLLQEQHLTDKFVLHEQYLNSKLVDREHHLNDNSESHEQRPTYRFILPKQHLTDKSVLKKQYLNDKSVWHRQNQNDKCVSHKYHLNNKNAQSQKYPNNKRSILEDLLTNKIVLGGSQISDTRAQSEPHVQKEHAVSGPYDEDTSAATSDGNLDNGPVVCQAHPTSRSAPHDPHPNGTLVPLKQHCDFQTSMREKILNDKPLLYNLIILCEKTAFRASSPIDKPVVCKPHLGGSDVVCKLQTDGGAADESDFGNKSVLRELRFSDTFLSESHPRYEGAVCDPELNTKQSLFHPHQNDEVELCQPHLHDRSAFGDSLLSDDQASCEPRLNKKRNHLCEAHYSKKAASCEPDLNEKQGVCDIDLSEQGALCELQLSDNPVLSKPLISATPAWWIEPHLSDKPFLCNICCHNFSTVEELHHHRSADHKDGSNLKRDVISPRDTEQSHQTLEIIEHCSKPSLTQRCDLPVDQGVNVCSDCRSSFPSKSSLIAHKCIRRHPAHYTKDGTISFVKKKVKRSEKVLALQNYQTIGIQPESTEKHKDNYRADVYISDSTRHNNRRMLSKHSQSKLTERQSGTKHSATQTRGTGGKRRFKCQYCEAAFLYSTHKKVHTRIHTGERPFNCTDCGSSFIDNGSLKRHKRIHTQDKPYTCIPCSKAYSDSSSLRRHLLAHHLTHFVDR